MKNKQVRLSVKINIISVGEKMPQWVIEAYNDYEKRLKREYQISLKQIALNKRSKHQIKKHIEKETQDILKCIKPGSIVVALDENGQQFSTKGLSSQLEKWQFSGQDISFVIGGPEGLHENILQKSDLTWSLSRLTLPHPMVRVILIEQIYRAWTLLKGLPYHRE
jgi:23S rRNA (pseudouridine1915-N3)-methyltransferase